MTWWKICYRFRPKQTSQWNANYVEYDSSYKLVQIILLF